MRHSPLSTHPNSLGRARWSFPTVWPLILILSLATPLVSACSRDASKAPRGGGPAPVLAALAEQKDMPVQVRAIGKVEPSATVSLKSRITGQLLAVHFTEGAMVRQGDLLFTIDPRPYELALREAQAKLARDQALAKKAEDDLKRYRELGQRQVVSASQLEQYLTDAQTKQATLAASQADVDNAKLNLTYCHITAPFGGPTGSLLAHQGNMVKANDDNKSLVVIQRIEPCYATFSVPERYLPEIRGRVGQGGLEVKASVPGQDSAIFKGALVFIDNSVDAATGTIKVKASFPNRDHQLWPAQFVNIVLTLRSLTGAVVVPAQALQTGQIGDFVYVIKEDMTVEARKVVLGPRIVDEAVIAEGLKPGEKIVTDGHLRLAPGGKVEIKPGASVAQGEKS
jgi:membrane fusion protein, multidrug efflux system